MKPVSDAGRTFECRHADVWPPAPAYTNDDPLTVRAERGDDAMIRYLAWRRDCGLMRMDLTKCGTCPHIIVDGVARTGPGVNGMVPPFMRRTRVKRSG